MLFRWHVFRAATLFDRLWSCRCRRTGCPNFWFFGIKPCRRFGCVCQCEKPGSCPLSEQKHTNTIVFGSFFYLQMTRTRRSELLQTNNLQISALPPGAWLGAVCQARRWGQDSTLRQCHEYRFPEAPFWRRFFGASDWRLGTNSSPETVFGRFCKDNSAFRWLFCRSSWCLFPRSGDTWPGWVLRTYLQGRLTSLLLFFISAYFSQQYRKIYLIRNIIAHNTGIVASRLKGSVT